MIPPDSHFVYALGWALVHFFWQGAALALVVRAAMAVLARRPANVRYVVACAGLAAMAIAPAATALMVSGPVPGSGVTVPAPAGEAVGVPASAPPASMAEAPPAAPSGAAWTSQLAALVEKSLGAIVVVWLVGVAAVSAVYLGGWVRVRRLVCRRVFPALERCERVAAELGRRMRVSRPVRCLESAAVGVPTLIGCLKPVILVPAGLATGLAPEEVEALLAHELAHVRRWDYLANMVQTAVETLLFYHPAVWWLSGRIRAEREQCCDEIVVATCGNRAAYARALAALADSQAVARPALAARGGRLPERIRRILAMQTERQGAVRWLAGSASLVGIGAVLVTALAIASCSGPGGGPSDAEKAPPAIADRPMMLSEADAGLDPALDRVQIETWIVEIKGGPLPVTLEGKAPDAPPGAAAPRKFELPGLATPAYLTPTDLARVLGLVKEHPGGGILSAPRVQCIDRQGVRMSVGSGGSSPFEGIELTFKPHVSADRRSVSLDWNLVIARSGSAAKRLEAGAGVTLADGGAAIIALPQQAKDPTVFVLLQARIIPGAGQPASPADRMSPEDEKRLRETQQLLEKDIDVDFEQTSRADILKFLSGASGANIVVSPDVTTTQDGDEGLKWKINVQVKRVTIKHVLRIVLGELFTYEVGPGHVLVKMKG